MAGHSVKFLLNPKLYLRDPQETAYGQKLLKHSIELMDELGFEAFTFKKLAIAIESTEASIYRYFENKHMLLLFLTSWYWEWVNYLIGINTTNISDSERRLKIIIHNIVNASTENPLTEFINESALHSLVIKEGAKSYHIIDVDDENKHGFFQSYKTVVQKVAEAISAYRPKFPYPNMLASNLFEMANNQVFFAEHLPGLTDLKKQNSAYDDLEEAMQFITFKVLT